MDFEDYEYRLPVSRGNVIVRVKADLIHMFWGDGIGPQDAAGIVAANRTPLDTVAMQKMMALGMEDVTIELSETDWH